jgi:hypothetical protein
MDMLVRMMMMMRICFRVYDTHECRHESTKNGIGAEEFAYWCFSALSDACQISTTICCFKLRDMELELDH